MKTKIFLKHFCLLIGLFLTFPIYAQETLTITGTVTGENDGMPIPGATIQVENTSNGTVTDFNGNFTITTDPNAVLIISYIGFETQEVPVNGRTEINISLATDSEQLQEIVVVGYGTQKKVNMTSVMST